MIQVGSREGARSGPSVAGQVRPPPMVGRFWLLWIVDLAEMKLSYCCTVSSVPACVVKPLYIAIVGWSPLASEGGTTTLN